jgi:hypothetical protein
MPVPQPAGPNLSHEIQRVHRRGSLIDQYSEEYLRLERELRKLIKSDAVSAYWMLGALSGYAGDIDAMHSNYRNARRLAPGDSCARINYLITTVNLGFFSEAVKDLAFFEKPEHGELEKAITLNIECARFRTALRLIKKWNEVHQDNPWKDSSAELVGAAAEIVENAKIEEAAFLPILDTIGTVLRAHKLVFLQEPDLRILDEEGTRSISFRFLVNAPARAAAEMESEIVDKMFDLGVSLHESTIRFGLIAAQELVKKAA